LQKIRDDRTNGLSLRALAKKHRVALGSVQNALAVAA
jgi:hypothetical protein